MRIINYKTPRRRNEKKEEGGGKRGKKVMLFMNLFPLQVSCLKLNRFLYLYAKWEVNE